jgi:hypothetical protein
VGVFPASVADVPLHIPWSGPALAAVGWASDCIVTLLEEGVHPPFEIVHSKVTEVPGEIDVMVVFGSDASVIVAVPEVILQLPVPEAGVFADKLAEVILQTVWLLPALEVVGGAATLIDISELDEGQTPLLTVHLNTAVPPTISPVTADAGLFTEETDALPEITLHVPAPIVGATAERVVEVTLHKFWLEPASAVEGSSLIIIVTSSVLVHVPLLIVHCIAMVSPTVRPVIVVVGSAASVIVAVPETTDHAPVPTDGVFPANVAEVTLHRVWSVPALAVVGLSYTFTITSSVEFAHTPFEIVHRNVEAAPIVNPVIPEVGDVGVVMDAEPEITDHEPVPTDGEFPANVVVVVLHRFWFVPASATVGDSSTETVTSLVEGVHAPLEIVHLNIEEVPMVSPVTPEFGEEGVVTEAEPDTTDHAPVPEPGVLAAIVVVVVLHSVWFVPAFDAVGVGELTIITSEVVGVHAPLDIVHLNVDEPPIVSPVTPVAGSEESVIVAVPETTLHAPVPIAGVFAANVVVVVLHKSWLSPASAASGFWPLSIVTSSKESGQTPFDIVHCNTADEPATSPVTPDVGDVGLEMVAVPEETVHCPLPIAGLLPSRVVVVTLHKPWSVPAFAVEGSASTFIFTVEEEAGQFPFVILHLKVAESPTIKPVTVVVGSLASVMVAVPESNVQLPVPTAAGLPSKVVAVVLHKVWLEPALAVVGGSSVLIVISSKESGQEPLEIVHL